MGVGRKIQAVLRAPSFPLALNLCLKLFIKCNFFKATPNTGRARSPARAVRIHFVPHAQLSRCVTPRCIRAQHRLNAPALAPLRPPPHTSLTQRISVRTQSPTSAQIIFNQQPQQSFASPVIKPSVWSQPSSPYGDLAHTYNPSMLGKWLQGYLERIPMPTTVHSSRGSPSLPATHTVKHILPENFALEGEKQKKEWPDKKVNNISLGLGCFNLKQDGNPGWTRLGSSPSPLSLPHPHSPSIYSGATFPKHKPSPTGPSRQQSLPLLQLHLNYSLLPRQLHTNHCYLGYIATTIPEQRPALLLPALNCSIVPFPLTPKLHWS